MGTEILQDEVVYASDMNRSSSQVLNRASRFPITIIRNTESFVLMRRDLAAGWRKEATLSRCLAELIWHALSGPDERNPEFNWMQAFDDEDRQKMVGELMECFQQASRDGSWSLLETAIHEWEESGLAAQNSDFVKSYAESGSPEGLSLPDPGTVGTFPRRQKRVASQEK